MNNRLVLIHALPSLIAIFTKLGSELLPRVQMLHILDEPLLESISQSGGMHKEDTERLRAHIKISERIHTGAVLVTCTLLSASIDEISSAFRVPIIKIDEVLADRAVATGERIGMVVTNPDTLVPSSNILYARAALVDKTITVESSIVKGAFKAIRKGDGAAHDRLVKQVILNLAPGVDVIVLAQASMARVLDVLPKQERVVPILSSPHLALEQARTALQRASA